MLVCTDVDYRPGGSARAAGLGFGAWTDAAPLGEWVERLEGVQPYQPGEFYRRELPCLLALLGTIKAAQGLPEAVIIDGYVTLDAAGRAGLGLHLYRALGGAVPVIGVAKTAFRGSGHALPVCRGGSSSPLYVTAAGQDAGQAALHLAQMHGPHRLPTLLRRVDGLCRTAE